MTKKLVPLQEGYQPRLEPGDMKAGYQPKINSPVNIQNVSPPKGGSAIQPPKPATTGK